MSDGPRPLPARQYFARLTKAFVTALSAPMAEGRLFEVDMRLRPSGRQGPVATSWAAFREYQMNEAWVWEHLALTRARPVAGNMALGAGVEAFRGRLIAAKGGAARAGRILGEVREMRARLKAEKGGRGIFDAKLGRGRLLDIELCAQTGALLAGATARDVQGQLQAACRCGWIDESERRALLDAHDLFWRLQAASRLLADRVVDPGEIGAGGRAFLLANCGADSIAGLEERLAGAAKRAGAVIDAALERRPSRCDEG